LLSWTTQDRLSLRKYERRLTWQKKTAIGPMSLAHKLSMELRAAEDRTQQMAREVEHWQERAARAEQWLRTIQQEIEEKLLTRRSFSGAEGVAVR
jgi:uncharacterized protein YlxW (UPF0749 family)